jgi:hypothetical protein
MEFEDHYVACSLKHTMEHWLWCSNRYAKWEAFRYFVSEKLSLKVPLKTEEDIEAAVKYFNDTMQWDSWKVSVDADFLKRNRR